MLLKVMNDDYCTLMSDFKPGTWPKSRSMLDLLKKIHLPLLCVLFADSPVLLAKITDTELLTTNWV